MSKKNMAKALAHHKKVLELTGENYYEKVKSRTVEKLSPSDRQLYKDFHTDPLPESLSPVKKVGDNYVKNDTYEFNDARKTKLLEKVRNSTSEAHRQGLDSASSFIRDSKPRPKQGLDLGSNSNLTNARDLLAVAAIESVRPSVAGEGSDTLPPDEQKKKDETNKRARALLAKRK